MFRMSRRLLAAAALMLTGGFGLAGAPAGAAEVNLYSTREPGLITPLLEKFTAETGIKVNTVFLSTGLAERVAAEGASSPADVLMVVDIGNMMDLVKKGLTQPVRSPVLDAAIPANLRAGDGQWFALSLRARAILVSRERVTDAPKTYEELADPRWRGKVCLRGGQHPYNTALFAAMLAKEGEAATTAYLTALKANLGRKPGGGDRDVARDILAGLCDVGLINTYYGGLMLSGAGGAEQKRWGEAVRFTLPTFKDGAGTHVNVSAAAIARNAPNKAAALRLMEWLVSPAAQKAYAEANFEYPVLAEITPHAIIAGFGKLRVDSAKLEVIAANREKASMLVDQTGFDR